MDFAGGLGGAGDMAGVLDWGTGGRQAVSDGCAGAGDRVDGAGHCGDDLLPDPADTFVGALEAPKRKPASLTGGWLSYV